jgi:transposase-like protein
MNSTEETIKDLVKINEPEVRKHLSDLVRVSIEETLNQLLDEEATRLCRATKYERVATRCDKRAGKYKRKFLTKSGEVTLEIPKLRQDTFKTAIIERYKRRESSVEDAMVEMYLAGVSTRRIEDISETLYGSSVSAGTISNLNSKVFEKIKAWRERGITKRYEYLYLDGIVLKRCFSEEVRHICILVAMGVSSTGEREIIGVQEGLQESYESWKEFLIRLRSRGLEAAHLVISDAHLGLSQALGEVFTESKWQRCVVHFYRNVLDKVKISQRKEVALMLKAIHGQESKEEAIKKADNVAVKLEELKLTSAAKLVREKTRETLAYYDFPSEHWRRIRTNNPLERIMKEIRRRTRVVGSFPDGEAAINLVSARLRYIETKWSDQCYLNMEDTNELAA